MILDLLTGLLVAYGFYQGFSKGLIKTVFASLSLIIGIVAALKLSPILIGLLQESININPAVSFVIGFVLTFIIVMALVRFIGSRIEKLLESINIGGLDKLLGGILLGLFYAIIVSFAVHFMDKIQLINEETKTASITYPLLKPLPQATAGIGQTLKPVFTEFWDKMMDTMDSLKVKGEELSAPEEG